MRYAVQLPNVLGSSSWGFTSCWETTLEIIFFTTKLSNRSPGRSKPPTFIPVQSLHCGNAGFNTTTPLVQPPIGASTSGISSSTLLTTTYPHAPVFRTKCRRVAHGLVQLPALSDNPPHLRMTSSPCPYLPGLYLFVLGLRFVCSNAEIIGSALQSGDFFIKAFHF